MKNEFKAGDKVVLTHREINDSHEWLQEGDVGFIIDVPDDPEATTVAIQFTLPEGRVYHGWLSTKGGKNDGWWVDKRCLKLISQGKDKNTLIIQVAQELQSVADHLFSMSVSELSTLLAKLKDK